MPATPCPVKLFNRHPPARFELSKLRPSPILRRTSNAKMKIKLAQFGLGPIGIETLKLAATKSWAKIVGGIDIDPAKVGKNLADLTGIPSLKNARVYGSLDELLARSTPDLIFHTSVSKIKAAVAQVEPMARAGISVVSSCEELLYPPLREPKLAKQLDGKSVV